MRDGMRDRLRDGMRDGMHDGMQTTTHQTLRPATQRAAFIDRDGVLNVDHGYVYKPEDFQWLPRAVQALQQLQKAAWALVVVTNQSGVARGLYTLAQMQALHHHMTQELLAQGVVLTGIYACPHHPQGSVPAYTQVCDCRKPGPGLIRQAQQAHALDLAASVLFGDKPSDIAAGRQAGVGRCWWIGEAAAGQASGADGSSTSLWHAVQVLAPEP